MTISVETEKALDKIQVSFMIKNSQQTGNKREPPKLDKTPYKNPQTSCLMIKD